MALSNYSNLIKNLVPQAKAREKIYQKARMINVFATRQNISWLTNVKPEYRVDYIAYGIATKMSVFSKIQYANISEANIEKRLTAARLHPLISRYKDVPRKQIAYIENGKKHYIYSPAMILERYKRGRITLEELNRELKEWKRSKEEYTAGSP